MPGTPTSNPSKIGFFGGSFDPIHQGHVCVALASIKRFNLQKVLLCPAFHAPLRQQKPLFSPQDRAAMVDAVCHEHPQLQLFDHEISSGKTCYTYHTLQAVREIFPADKIFLMLGDDQFNKFDQWKYRQQILSEYSLIVFNRSGTETGEAWSGKLVHRLENPLFPHSSTKIRQHLEAGTDVSRLIPASVFSYMKKNQLLAFNNS